MELKLEQGFNQIIQNLSQAKDRMLVANNYIEKEVSEKEVDKYECELQKYIQYKVDGDKIHSRQTWYEQDESSTKFFFGLEKTRYNNKTIRALMLDNKEITHNEKRILYEQQKYYRKLYEKRPDIKFMFSIAENEVNGFDKESKEKIDEEFTFEEFTKALKSMARGKAPGNDGLGTSFYIVMWTKIGEILWEAICEAREKGQLHRSARRGVISLIPKRAKNPIYLTNYRPLMLLNTDHKIVSKMLANRLKSHLHKVIGKQQCGYVPGHFIGTNIRKMIDVLQYLEKEQIPALLLVIDYEKCFDSLSHEALEQSLRYFNVGNNFIGLVLMLYNGFEFCVINNGRWSGYQKQSRGVHQGSALSGPLFLFPAEILARNLCKNTKIKPVEICGLQEQLEQYADDTSIWSMYSAESINAIIEELEVFYKSTGLKVNYDKSTIYRVGAKTQERLYMERKFKWGKNVVEVLGIIMQLDGGSPEINFAAVLEKASATLKIWQSRAMSLAGKIHITNALIGSLFVYKMQVLPAISAEIIAKITKMLTEFIWNGRKPKIRTEYLTLDKSQGGRKLVNIATRDKALKVEWMRRLHDETNADRMITVLAYYYINASIKNQLFWECNFCKDDCKQFEISSDFWRSVVTAWAEVNLIHPKAK